MNSHARPSQLAPRGAPGATPGHGSRLHAHFAARPQPRGSPHATEGFSSCNPVKGPCAEGSEESWQGRAAGQHHPALRVFFYPDAKRPTRASPLDTRATKHRLPPPAVETTADTCPGQPCQSRVRQGWCPRHHPPSQGTGENRPLFSNG